MIEIDIAVFAWNDIYSLHVHQFQGYSLIKADFDDTHSSRLTWQYGIVTIAINWLPGVVAAIHIMAMYRHNYSAKVILLSAGKK